jgi:zinc transport system substrate-binding protein
MTESLAAAAATAFWCGLHSVLITPSVMTWSRRRSGRWFAWHRVAFIGFAGLSLLALLFYVEQLPARTLWRWHGAWQVVRVAGLAVGVWITILGSRAYDQRHFLGLAQAAEFFTGRPAPSPRLKRDGILARVRHPYYGGAFWLLAFYADFTDVNLAVRGVFTAYLLIGTALEERKLLREFGADYARYRREVPRFLPRPWRRAGADRARDVTSVCGAVAGLALLATATACGPRDAPDQGGGSGRAPTSPVSAVVSIPPQAYFVDRLAAERAAVTILVGPGDSPATFAPTAQQLAALTGAQVYFRIGVPMEQALVPRLARNYPRLRIVDTRGDTSAAPTTGPAGEPPHGDHDHGGYDPHVWLSARLAAGQAALIAETLADLDPDGADRYRHNLAAITTELARLDAEIGEILAPVHGGTVYVFHPAFGYLCADYGLNQVAIEAGGLSPSPRHLATVLTTARAAGARAIFVQPQSSTAAARTVAAELGIDVVTLDPLARDYPDNLLRIARAFRAALDPRATDR